MQMMLSTWNPLNDLCSLEKSISLHANDAFDMKSIEWSLLARKIDFTASKWCFRHEIHWMISARPKNRFHCMQMMLSTWNPLNDLCSLEKSISLHANDGVATKYIGFLWVEKINRIHEVFSIKMPKFIMYMKFFACFGSMGGANAVRFALAISPVGEKTCSLGVDLDSTARTMRARAANWINVSAEACQNRSTTSQTTSSFKWRSISAMVGSSVTLGTVIWLWIRFSRIFLTLPPSSPHVPDDSTGSRRFNDGDAVDGASEETDDGDVDEVITVLGSETRPGGLMPNFFNHIQQ